MSVEGNNGLNAGGIGQQANPANNDNNNNNNVAFPDMSASQKAAIVCLTILGAGIGALVGAVILPYAASMSLGATIGASAGIAAGVGGVTLGVTYYKIDSDNNDAANKAIADIHAANEIKRLDDLKKSQNMHAEERAKREAERISIRTLALQEADQKIQDITKKIEQLEATPIGRDRRKQTLLNTQILELRTQLRQETEKKEELLLKYNNLKN